MAEHFTYYDVLGVKPTASLDDIKRAYKENAPTYHPDVNKAPNANSLLTMLNVARDTLCDPVRRAAYDRSIGLDSQSNSSASHSTAAAAEAERRKREAERRRQAQEAEQRRRQAEAERERASAEKQRTDDAQRQREETERARREAAVAAELRMQRELAEAAQRNNRRLKAALLVVGCVVAGIIFLPSLARSPNVSQSAIATSATSQPTFVTTTPPASLHRGQAAYITKPNAVSQADQIQRETVQSVASPNPPLKITSQGLATTTPYKKQQSDIVKTNVVGCTERLIRKVANEGATVDISDGTSYQVSDLGGMRLEVSSWSTGDQVTVCRSGTSAALENHGHFNEKVQASFQGTTVARSVTCSERTIARVADEGATVDTSDGTSYEVSDLGGMRLEVSSWSTGDQVAVCRSDAAASLENHGHFNEKVQASFQGTTVARSVTCNERAIARVADEGATVDTSDGSSYQISDLGGMRLEVGSWSTGDQITVCRSGASASIENHDHFNEKVQATIK